MASNLHSQKETINRCNAKNDINRIIDGSAALDLSNKELKQIMDVVKTISKWDAIKHGGKQCIPSGDATNAFNRLDSLFRSHHIYLVPVGELEGFIKEVGGHGPEWVNKVLEKYPDLNGFVYHGIVDFVRSIGQ